MKKVVMVAVLAALFVVSISGVVAAAPCQSIDPDYNGTGEYMLDADGDGIGDCEDVCPNSIRRAGDPDIYVDIYGCDIYQFCGKFRCGASCHYADWRGDAMQPAGGTNGTRLDPKDCDAVVMASEGKYFPLCVPRSLTCEPKDPDVPEFGMIAAGIALVGAIGLIIAARRTR